MRIPQFTNINKNWRYKESHKQGRRSTSKDTYARHVAPSDSVELFWSALGLQMPNLAVLGYK
ncbi:hypothetical protein ACU8KH_05679 [Lachancea thermotolerans]